MAIRCPRCGHMAMDDERFCTKCGENLDTVHYEQKQMTDNFDMNAYDSSHIQYPSSSNEEMTFGKWLVTVLVTNMFGLISLIFLFIWGFGNGPESRKRYCKAMLIVKAIAIGLSIVFMMIWSVVVSNIIDKYYTDYYHNNYSYYYDGYDSGTDTGTQV